jgi:hypothetical protein
MKDRRYVAFHLATILATPFLILAVQPNLFINPNTNANIDSWVYTGFFLSLPEHLARWSGTYYATRLSWILPGFAAHQLLPALLANYVLHLGFFYLLLFSVYALATSGMNRTTAFIVTLLVAWNPELLAAMSWDYVDGAVITYFTVSLLCLEKASSGAVRWWLWAAAAGVGLACVASANLVGTTLWPICGLFLFLRAGATRWRTAVAVLAVAAVGAIATFAVFGFVNQQFGGQLLYLKASVDYAGSRLWLPSPWDVAGLGWLPDTPHLILPAVAALGAVLAFAGRSNVLKSFPGTVQLTFLAAVVWWVIHSTLWTHSVHVSYYVSYLVPLGLLAFAAHPDSPLAVLPSSRLWHAITLELAILGLLIIHLLVFRRGDVVWEAAAPALGAGFATPNGINAFVAVGVGVFALALLRFVRPLWFRWPAFLLALLMAYSSVPTNWATHGTLRVREDFAVTVSAHRFIGQHLDRNRGLRLWYSLAPGEPRPFRSISSTYLWGWTLVNEAMPSLDAAQAASLVPDAQLVVLADTGAEVDAARETLRKSGFDYATRTAREFGASDRSFWVVIGRLSRAAESNP